MQATLRCFGYLTLTAVAVTLVTISSPRVEAQQPGRPWDGMFTAVEASRGESSYVANCAACHGSNLAGGNLAPAVAGAGFMGRWGAGPLANLLDYVQSQMPLQMPGGLTRRQYADIVAFLLVKNGMVAGQRALVPETEAPVIARVTKPPAELAAPSTKRAEGFFTEVQATRGKALFNRNCGLCHTVDPRLSTPEDLVRALPRTFGGHFIERIVNGKLVYPSVFYLYSKMESMPAFNTKMITPQQRADIATYILQANGLPAGEEELTTDTEAMKMMMLNEPGFERIFNGKDFTGIDFVVGQRCLLPPDGCAKTDPGSMVRVENGVIVCECNVHGEWSTRKLYQNFTLRYDVKFEHPADFSDGDDEELFSGGGGIKLLSNGKGGRIEIQGRHRDMLEVAPVGGSGYAKWSFDLEARRRVIRPLGHWNSVEIVAKDGKVYSSLNGTLISTITEHDYSQPGPITFQIEGAKKYWRNVRVRVD